MSDVNIRLECLRPAERWVQPTGCAHLGLGCQGRPHGAALGWRGFADPLCRLGDPLRSSGDWGDLERPGLTPAGLYAKGEDFSG